jgi:hypothetical protein
VKFREFVGGTYASSALMVDQELAINLFSERIAGDGGNGEEWILKRSPGAALLVTLPDSPIRGMTSTQNRIFVVSGFTFYELTLTGQVGRAPTMSYIARGTLTTVATPTTAVMKSTSVEVMIVADGSGYIFNLSTAVFTKITAPAFPAGVSTLAMIDTYFLVNSGLNTGNQFAISSPLAGLSWAALDFGSSQEPDSIQALAELHLSLWVFGRRRIVVFQNTGAAGFPFQRIPGATIDIGLAAPYSIQNVDNTLFWLGSNEAGLPVVYRADGLLPTRVSNHAIEWIFQSYLDVNSAISSTYQEEGHLFYRLDFPSAITSIGGSSAGATWLYDVSTKRWHQRALWNAGTSSYGADPARFHSMQNSIWHIVGDYRSGAVLHQAADYSTWAGSSIRWLRRCPHIADDDRVRMFYRSMEILFGVSAIGSSSIAMSLSWSDDGGATWPAAHAMTHATPGDYRVRAVFRRLGSARSRVFELSGADTCARFSIAGATLQIEKGTS